MNGKWTFAHPKLTRENPDAVLEITRKTRMSSVAYTPREEFEKLRAEVHSMKRTIANDMSQMKDQISDLYKMVNSLKQTLEQTQTNNSRQLMTNTPPLMNNSQQQFSNFGDLDLRQYNSYPLPIEFENPNLGKAAPTKKIKLSPSVCSGGTNATDPVLDFMLNGFALPVRDCDVQQHNILNSE